MHDSLKRSVAWLTGIRIVVLLLILLSAILVQEAQMGMVYAREMMGRENPRVALLSKRPKKSFKEFLLEMPEGGDDAIFERHRSRPREVSL